MNEITTEDNNSISRFAHVLSRINAYSNWYSLVWPLNRLGGKAKIITIRNGPSVYVRNIFGPDWVVVHEMFSRDDYQIKDLPLGSAPIIFDIGANIGAFTLFAEKCFPLSRVFAYEPASTNFEILKKNIALNHLENEVKAFQLAVAVAPGEAMMTYSDEEFAHSLIADQVETEHIAKSEKVRCTSIPEIISEHKLARIDLIKMDIEGLEYDLLFALPDDVYKMVRYITLEIHDHKDHPAEELITFLKEKGFSVVRTPTHPKVYLATNTELT